MRNLKLAIYVCSILLLACTMIPKASRSPAADQGNGCGAHSTLPKNFNVQDIRAMLLDPEIKTVENMLSCLARDLDLKVLLVHTSMAAQNSDSLNPRALAFVMDETRNVQAAFTVNSGESHLIQSDSVEFMFNDANKKELEFYDIAFKDNRGHLSAPNPELCMSCHGINGQVPVGGPKPLFDRDPWPRIVMKHSDFFPSAHEDILCPSRRRAHRILDAVSLHAYDSKPRYAPLRGEKFADVDSIDFAMESLNARRIAKWISNTPDYQTFKYAILGAARGCMDEPADLISADHTARMTNVSKLNPKVQSALDNIDLETFHIEESISQWRQNLRGEESNKSLFSEMKAHRPVYFNLHIDGSRACAPPFAVKRNEIDPDREIRPQVAKSFAENKRPVLPATVFDKYKADPINADTMTKVFRYLFETRGLDISDWDTQPLEGYGRAPGFLEKSLLELEPEHSPDYAVIKKINELKQLEACPQLKKLSHLRMSKR